ncbi:creatininase family protein, partial [Verrucomicrobiota bacterium]
MRTDPPKVKWEEMFPEELYDAIRRDRVCFMAYGLAEPHGPYNAIGLDWLKAQALVECAAQEHGGVVAPPFAWHITERPEYHDNGRGKGWLCDAGVKQALASSIPMDLFYRTVLYTIRAFDARGFQAAILVTGHYGGPEKIMRRLCEYYRRRSGSPIQLTALADWECIDYEGYGGDHAGTVETSQLMHLRPGLTDLSRTHVPPELGTNYAGFRPGDPNADPSEELGRNIVESQVRRLGEIRDELLAAYEPVPDWKAPSLNDAEAIWHRFHTITQQYRDMG